MNRIFSIILALSMFSCATDGKPKKPKNLIPKQEMAEILYDVYILNSAKGINKKILEVNGVFPEEYVFKKYNIDSVQFAKSNDYYAYETQTYLEIIDSVRTRLEREKKIYEDIKNKEEVEKKRLRDSLNAIYKNERDTGVKDVRRKPKRLLDSLK